VSRTGDSFARNGYVPQIGHIVHLNWDPAVGHEMKGPHYGLVLSADAYNIGTGFCVVCPITSKIGKLSGFELAVQSGRVNGAAILSALRSLDYRNRDVRFEAQVPQQVVAEANRRVRMIFP
jgi:mRNA-degrading endonuclease toxin of MazEF toxin-antitoxin module